MIIMAARWKDIKKDPKVRAIDEKHRVLARAYVDDVRRTHLAELRKTHGTTQMELAQRMGVRQATVSDIENRVLDHMEIATLRSYVEVLGGSLHITAHFDGEEHEIA